MAKTARNDNSLIQAFYPKNQMANRSQKRRISFEGQKLMNAIGEIETQFLVDLFFSEHDYKDLYSKMKKEYLQFLKSHKFKHIIPNVDYLELKYKPVR